MVSFHNISYQVDSTSRAWKVIRDHAFLVDEASRQIKKYRQWIPRHDHRVNLGIVCLESWMMQI